MCTTENSLWAEIPGLTELSPGMQGWLERMQSLTNPLSGWAGAARDERASDLQSNVGGREAGMKGEGILVWQSLRLNFGGER